jgi:hypothetical protein
VSGTVLVGDQPKPRQSVVISSSGSPVNENFLTFYLKATCDADGLFSHHRVPPGEYQIGLLVKQGRNSMLTGAVSHEIKAGDQLTLEIGGAGQAVIGQCLWDRVEALTASVTMVMQEPGSEKNKQFFFGTVDQDGGFRVDNLLPGQYKLTISVSELGDFSQGPFGQAVGSVKLDVVVPELPTGVKYIDTPIDVGVHEITIGEKGRGVAGQCIWDGEEDCITIVGLSTANLKTGATEQNYSAEVFENGGFYFENVVPGQYELEVMIFARRDLEGFGNPFGNQIGELKVEIEVPELTDGEKPDMPVDLGELKIEITAPETEI